METLQILLFYVLASIIGITIYCIKENRNIIDELHMFFREWWEHIKIGIIFLLGLYLVCYMIGH